MMRAHVARLARRTRLVLPVIAPLVVAMSCSENLPNGPNTFVATLKIGVAHDTLVVGDSSAVQAIATDGSGRTIQSLSFVWASADSAIVGFAAPAATSDGSSGRARTLVGKRSGRSVVTLTLPDPRFGAPAAPRTETVVVAGVRILTTRDSTLTAVNDTAVAIAAAFVRSNGALVTRPSQGIRWIHLGSHTTVVGTGDTIRYIARSNGADTLIATHDFCLITAKCADSAIVRVSQQLSMSLSSHAFRSWSFSDSVGPTVTIADRRGNGVAGTSVRLVPVTASDSAVAKISAAIGTSNPATGLVASPRLIAIRNDSALVRVFGIGPDGITVVGTDSITDIVRQVARHVQVEPLRAVVTVIDSIPYRALARDARGAVIGDATVTVTAAGITFNATFAGPNPAGSTSTQGTLTPNLTGIALPAANPLAPQVPVIVDPAVIALVPFRGVTAATAVIATMTVLDSNGVAAAGSWVRFRASAGIAPDSVQVATDGTASVAWIPPAVPGPYTLTGVRGAPAPLFGTDSSVRTVLQQSVVVVAAGGADPTRSTLAVSATSVAVNLATTTVTVTAKDVSGNPVTTATPADFTLTAARGTISGTACTLGVCTATYTAPATAGAESISAKIVGVQIVFSPIAMTITP
jgi:hypothetical protein